MRPAGRGSRTTRAPLEIEDGRHFARALAKLDERGFVDYEKYRGVRLTDNGEELASRVAWRFCVVTSFFDSVLDTTLEDHTAFDIGFTLPEKGVYRLRERVNTPCLETCPESGRSDAACLV